MIDVKTNWATYKDCFVRIEKYSYNDSLAISLWNHEDGPIANLTVCLVNEPLDGENSAYVDTNNCPWAMDLIEEYGLGEFWGEYGFSEYCYYPLVYFDMEKLEEHSC